VGGSVSLTVTVKEQVLVLPLASMAVQFTVVTPLGKVEPLEGAQLTVAPGQLSLAVAAYVTTASQAPGAVFTTMGAGHVAVGGSVSLTVMVKEQLAVLPLASAAVQFTVVLPLGKVEPLAGAQLMLAPGQLSLAVAVKVTTASQAPGVVLTVMGAGHVAVGGSVSLTVTVTEQVLVLPLASVAVQFTVVTPLAKVEPLEGAQLMLAPGQLSLAVAV
jgi:hypothetical protein